MVADCLYTYRERHNLEHDYVLHTCVAFLSSVGLLVHGWRVSHTFAHISAVVGVSLPVFSFRDLLFRWTVDV